MEYKWIEGINIIIQSEKQTHFRNAAYKYCRYAYEINFLSFLSLNLHRFTETKNVPQKPKEVVQRLNF